MKNKNAITLIICLVLLVGLIAGGTAFYNANKTKDRGSFTVIDEDKKDESEKVEETDDEVGENDENTAPDVEFFDNDKNSHMLSDFFDKPVVLNFWASWCGPCKSEMPGFDKLYKEYGDRVHFIMLNVDDTRETVKKFISDNGYSFPIYFDDTNVCAYTYGASSIPLTFVLYEGGKVYGYQIGVLPEEALLGAIKTVLGEE